MPQESVKHPPLPKPEIARIEQRTLFVSLTAVLVLAVGSILYGLIIESEVVILNGVLSLISLVGSSLNLWGAKLVTSKEDNCFQFGYWHIEPLIHCSNALMLLLICIYGALSGIEQLRGGGNPSDPTQIVIFSVVSGIICGAVWLYETINARKTQSQFLRNDSNEWLLDFCLSIGTMLGFIPLFFLSDPLRHFWSLYADGAMVVLLSLLLMYLPIGVLRENVPEVLLMTSSDASLVQRVRDEMGRIAQDYAIIHFTHHIAKVGQMNFLELNILVDPACNLQTIEIQDRLRERIWRASGLPLDSVWLTVNITADPRWG